MYPQEIKFAVIAEAGNGTDAIVAAVTGKRILVLGYDMGTDTAQTLQWKSASDAISGVYTLAANDHIERDNPYGVMKTAEGEALNLTQVGGAAVIGGVVTYIEL